MDSEANFCHGGILYVLHWRNFHWASNCEWQKFCQCSKKLAYAITEFLSS